MCTAIDYSISGIPVEVIVNNKNELQEGDILILSKGSTLGTMCITAC